MNSNTTKGPGRVLILPLLAVAIFTVSVVTSQAAPPSSEKWESPSRAARKKNPIPADSASLERGLAVYVKECTSCHGKSGRGDGPAAKNLERHPGDLTNPKLIEQSDGALFWKITTGRPPMASYKKTLTKTDRWHVINYTRTLAGPTGK